MSRPPVLTKPQEKVLRARVRAGADLPALQFHVQQKGWKVSRSVLGELLKDERARMAEGGVAPKAEKPLGTIAQQVEALTERVAELEALLTADLSDEETDAPEMTPDKIRHRGRILALKLAGSKGLDPKARVEALKVLGQLTEKSAADEGSDDSPDLFDPSKG